ncbi:hypothetical protein [Aeromicrobium sp. PE09-221]|uniref:hypothetical protein n=1 Tax=Aeromicrobium sp. PE09-221 TaxID=1898043 RepID=UPI0014838F73|nr:hypothetical protein [Aeromicrobium sp. PE09-221]
MTNAMLTIEVLETAGEAARCPWCERGGALFDTLSADHLGVECRWCDFADLEEIATLV